MSDSHAGSAINLMWILSLALSVNVQGETDGSLRLQGGTGTNNNTGRLEVFLDGRWGTVCGDSFGRVEGILACNQLGYASLLESFTSGTLGVPIAPPSTPILLSGVNCSGTKDLTIFNCPRRQSVSSTCDHTRDVALTCTAPYSTMPGSVRLVPRIFNSMQSYIFGRVEVFYSGRWGTVCSDDVNSATADALCAEATGIESSVALAHGTADSSGLRFSSPGREGDPIWTQFSCSTSTDPCQRHPLGSTTCTHNQDLAISCLGDGALRLVSSSSPSNDDGGSLAGRLEIYFSGEWGTVCDDGFGHSEASVVCRQLGYGSQPHNFGNVTHLGFPSGSGTIWLDNVKCRSSESALLECDNRGLGVHDCSHAEDVAVSCSDAEDLTAVILIAVFGGGGGLFVLCVIIAFGIGMCLVCYHCGVVKTRQTACMPTDTDDLSLDEESSHPQAETHDGEPPPSYEVASNYPLVNAEDLDRSSTETIEEITIEESTIEESTIEDTTIEV